MAWHASSVIATLCAKTLRLHTSTTAARSGFVQQASLPEVMAFIERQKLHGLGCGFVDMALLASACVTPEATLWTLDKKLLDLATRFGVQFTLPLH